MPRPQKCRRICNKPEFTVFFPDNETEEKPIILTLDEFEVIRLVDLEKQTHEQAAKQMEIARSTVTEIYEGARYKIADSIVNGRRLIIEGGITVCAMARLPGATGKIVRNKIRRKPRI